mgnify:CR=1 FL=1
MLSWDGGLTVAGKPRASHQNGGAWRGMESGFLRSHGAEKRVKAQRFVTCADDGEANGF